MPGNTTSRRRTLPSPFTKAEYGRYERSGTSPTVSEGWLDLSGKQFTVSEGHPFHSTKGMKGRTDLGGPFYTTKSYVKSGVKTAYRERIVKGAIDTKHTHVGAMLPAFAGAFVGLGTKASPYRPSFPPTLESTTDALEAKGAEAIARCEPTNSAANAATFLGELVKEGIPSMIGSALWKDKTSVAKAAGSDYLNVQFGWAPIVSEMRKFASAVQHADTVLAQYERDAGHVVRRRFEFPITEETSTTRTAVGQNAVSVGSNAAFVKTPTGAVWRTRKVERQCWFAGTFTYYLPSDYDSRNRIKRYRLFAEKILGLELTPTLVWDLAPWSWAVDWFSNAGDVVNNISKFGTGGLVMPYGYVMEKTTVTDSWMLVPANLLPEARLPIEPLVFVTETKKRIQANPFGFGVSWDGLSSFQLSILAALGMSRGR